MTPEPGELERVRAQRDAALARIDELLAVQEEFLHAASHDLRAPLRHVTSYAALLREVLSEVPAPPAPVTEALDFAATMQQSARRMNAMLDGLQALSRAGRAPLNCAAVSVEPVLERARTALALTPWLTPHAQLHWSLPPDLPALRADAALLDQLVRELLTNALKFSRASDPQQVQVSAERTVEGQVRLRFADNGVGFDEAHAQGLFGVFQRLHRDDEFDGVGAGLALCRRIAERHGATLALTARQGEGCTAIVDWPAA